MKRVRVSEEAMAALVTVSPLTLDRTAPDYLETAKRWLSAYHELIAAHDSLLGEVEALAAKMSRRRSEAAEAKLKFQSVPPVSGWLVRWDTNDLRRSYDQYPELRVEAGVPLVVSCHAHLFTAGVRLDGSDQVVAIEFMLVG